MRCICRVVVACTGKRQAQQLTGMDGDVIGLDGNGWVIVRTTDGSETLRIQQRYLSKRARAQDDEVRNLPTSTTERHIPLRAGTALKRWMPAADGGRDRDASG